MRRVFVLVPMIILLSCAGNSSKENSIASTAVDEAKTKEVFDRHGKAFAENDMEALLADYADDAVVVTPDRTVTGLTEIRAHFEEAFKAFPKDSSTYETIKTVIKGDLAFTVWKAKTPVLEFSYATDTFIVQNGKITRQTFAGH